ncbi:MAG: hypothetical protein DRI77_12220 [Chloroflexi bacterium]|nr:MAG: hypothetical protein DRI77_12220 [Chloroflexota bacterium]
MAHDPLPAPMAVAASASALGRIHRDDVGRGEGMMDTQKVWVDTARCTGCGMCVPLCPTGAITLVEGKAHVNEEMCTGCGVCIEPCPEGAIQPLVKGELVPAPARPAPTPYHPSPLAETAGAAVAVAGVGLLAKAAGALVRVVGRWLVRGSTKTGSPSRPTRDSTAGTTARPANGTSGGRRVRRRRRGK